MRKGKNESCEKLYRHCVNIITLLILLGVFADVWYRKFNTYIERSFENTGNILMLLIYLLVLWLSFSLWDASKVGYETFINVIASQVLAVIFTNIVTMFQITLLIGNVFYIIIILKEVFYIILKELIVCIIITGIGTFIYKKLFPPYHIIQINGYYNNYLRKKISSRDDKYKICEEVSVGISWEILKNKILKYDAVLINDIPSEDKNKILKYCFENSIRVYYTPKISDIIVKGSKVINLFDTPLYLCENIGLNVQEALIKRVMDIVLSVVGLIVTLPIFLITALAIKIYDRGPIFFVQKRCTMNGKVFWIYKFRSMIVDAEKDGKSRPASEKDDRITPVGKVIRATRIDELPQLINILKGEMSFVGPRPERIEHIEKYSKDIPEFQFRLRVKGGLTGYAQIYGKYNTTPYDKLKLDLIYILNYSPFLDIKIILMTIKIIFSRESTEGFTEERIEQIRKEDNE